MNDTRKNPDGSVTVGIFYDEPKAPQKAPKVKEVKEEKVEAEPTPTKKTTTKKTTTKK